MSSANANSSGEKNMIENLISYTGESSGSTTVFDLALFEQLNGEFAARPVVPAPREHATSYTSHIGSRRCEMLERKIGIRNLRVLEVGCGDGMLSRAMARDYGCDVTGVDVQSYDAWSLPVEGGLTQIVHDITAGDNATLGQFDRVVSFAVFEHIVHPHAALKASYNLLRPGGRAYIYANLYRGAKASHRYREVFFPWPHLLFEPAVWREFYMERLGEPLQAAWVNKLTYDQYVGMAERIGFEIKEHFPSAPYFDEAFYKRFEYQLAAYPKFDLMHDFIHLVLEKPLDASQGSDATPQRSASARTPMDLSELRRTLVNQPLRPYDQISFVKPRMEDIRSIVEGKPFKIRDFDFALGEEAGLGGDGAHRSKSLFFQSWNHFEPLFVAHSDTRDERVLETLVRQASLWIERFGNISLVRPAPPDGSTETDAVEDFVSSDTAIGNRFYRLAYLVAAVASSEKVDDATFAKLASALFVHCRSLASDRNFSGQHNHGFLQAIAQVRGASRFLAFESNHAGAAAQFGMAAAFEQGKQRLLAMLQDQIGADGVHKEHSPAYHAILFSCLDQAITSGIIDHPSLVAIRDKMRVACPWMYDQRGQIANLGDSETGLDMLNAGTILRDAPPAEGQQILFPDGGFWFVKTEGSHGPTYLAQSCAFHSRFHKQADSGTFIWHDRGTDILIDAGRYGYAGRTERGSPLFMDGFWYADPKRVYVESTRAHNTIEIDGRNHRRYRQQPTGGTIASAIGKDGVLASCCTVPNAGATQHRRFVALMPGEWLAVFDTCRFGDGPHEMRQWFHLHPDWLSTVEEGRLFLGRGDELLSVLAPITDSALGTPVSGETHAPRNEVDPGYLGWWSPQAGAFEPCTSFSVSGKGQFVTLATLFAFGNVATDFCRCHHNVTHRTIRLNWKANGAAHSLALTSQGMALNGFDLKYIQS